MTRYEMLTIAIAVIALIVSLFGAGLVQAVFGSFRPAAIPGLPVLFTKNTHIMLVVPMHLTNRGWRAGCIADLGIRVKALTAKSEWSLFPAFFLDFREYMKNVKNPEKSVESPFVPVALGPTQTVSKSILFAPRPPEHIPTEPLSLKDLKPGETYRVETYFLEADENCDSVPSASMKVSTSLDLTLKASHLEGLKRGISVAPLLKLA